MNAAHLDHVVLDLFEDQGVDQPLGRSPVRRLAGLERDELDGEPRLLRPGERLACSLGKLRVTRRQRVLELVIGKLLDLREVALGDELQVRLALLVPRQLFVDDGPRQRLSLRSGCECVPKPGGAGPKPAEAAGFFAAVRVVEHQAVPGGRRRRPSILRPRKSARSARRGRQCLQGPARSRTSRHASARPPPCSP